MPNRVIAESSVDKVIYLDSEKKLTIKHNGTLQIVDDVLGVVGDGPTIVSEDAGNLIQAGTQGGAYFTGDHLEDALGHSDHIESLEQHIGANKDDIMGLLAENPIMSYEIVDGTTPSGVAKDGTKKEIFKLYDVAGNLVTIGS